MTHRKLKFLSAIDGEEKKLALADAEQKAKQVQQKLDSDRANAKANMASIDQKRTKALRDVTACIRTASAALRLLRRWTAW